MPDARTTNRSAAGQDTLRLAHPETMVEPRPSDSTPSAEEMFLSPRVLDAGAFARYADTLKSLIADARQGARDLQDFAADADEMTIKCDKTAELIKSRVEAGARVIKLVDERADRAERLMQAARESLPDIDALRRDTEQATQTALAAADTRADAIARGVVAKSDIAVSDATRRIEQAAATIESRLEAVANRASEQADRLENASTAIDARLAAIEERLASVTERTQQAAERTQTDLEPVLARAEQATATIEATLAAAKETTQQHAQTLVSKIQEQIEPAQRACDAVLERLSMDPNDADPVASVLTRLEQLVSRSEDSLARADRATSDLGDLAGQAERVKNNFGTWLLEAATNLDILEARREHLAVPLAEAADRISRVSPSLKDDLEQAAVRLDQLQTEQAILREAIGTSAVLAKQSGETLNNQAAQMRALVDGSMLTLTSRVEEAGLWLGQLIQRAEQLGGMPPEIPSTRAEADPDPTEYAAQPMPNADQHAKPEAMMTEPNTSSNSVQPQQVRDTNQTAEPKMHDYGLPTPPALPIDAVSFDGAEVVFGDADENDRQAEH